MPNFSYVALDKLGREKKGLIVKQPNLESAYGELRKTYKYIISLKQERSIPALVKIREKLATIKNKELLIFYDQFKCLLESGQEISISLEIIERQTSNLKLSKILNDIRITYTAGTPLSIAFDRYVDVFGYMTVELIRLGEDTGDLAGSFKKLHQAMEKKIKLKGNIIQEIIGPCLSFFAIIALCVVLIVFVVPNIIEAFDLEKSQLPLLTRGLLGLANIISSYWWLIILTVVSCILAVVRYIKTDKGKKQLERLLLKVPLVKNLYKTYNVAYWCSNFSVLVNAGFSTIHSLSKLSNIVENSVYKEATAEASKAVEVGEKLGTVLNYNDLFPSMLVSLIAIGETTGRLKESLVDISRYQEDEYTKQVKTYVTLINPLMVFLLGFVLIIIAVPIFTLLSQIITNIQNI